VAQAHKQISLFFSEQRMKEEVFIYNLWIISNKTNIYKKKKK
jgi:hypothetical protein